MKVIRKSIFETNSSSSHSLSLGTLVDLPEQDIDELEITLGDGEYGWDWTDYDSWLDKADYITVDAREDQEKLAIIKKVIMMVYPSATIKFVDSGYIDHESCGIFWSEYKSEEEVKTFIFGDGGFSTGNDNDDSRDTMY